MLRAVVLHRVYLFKALFCAGSSRATWKRPRRAEASQGTASFPRVSWTLGVVDRKVWTHPLGGRRGKGGLRFSCLHIFPFPISFMAIYLCSATLVSWMPSCIKVLWKRNVSQSPFWSSGDLNSLCLSDTTCRKLFTISSSPNIYLLCK